MVRNRLSTSQLPVESEYYSRNDYEDYILIHLRGRRARDYLANLFSKLKKYEFNFSESDCIVLKNDTHKIDHTWHHYYFFHYKKASVCVSGSENPDVCRVFTQIAGSEDARKRAESKLIEMTGDDLQRHD